MFPRLITPMNTQPGQTEIFFRRLRLRGHYSSAQDPVNTASSESTNHSGDFDFESLKPKTTRWTPPPGQFSALDYYIIKRRREISKITSKFKERLRKTNITPQDWTALMMTIKWRNHVVIKPTDKWWSGGIVGSSSPRSEGGEATLRS